jgi:hypothetical protein
MADVAAHALGLFGLIGLTGFETLFYRAPQGGVRGNELVMDERDWMLSRRAGTAGMVMFWLFLCIAGMGSWAYLYFLLGLQRVNVPVGIFPGIISAGFIVFMLARSLATLHFYGWRADGAGR